MSRVDKIVSGLAWTFGSHIAQLIIGLVVSIILARVMQPSEFGLVGMISVFIVVGEVLMNGGFTNSLIRTKDPDEADYATVYYMNLGISLGLYIIIFIAAPWIAVFFHQPILVSMVRIYMLVVIIFAFSTVQANRLAKALNFRAIALCQVPALLISSVLGITMACLGCGVWSLIAMYLCRAVLFTIIIWWRSKWVPTFTFSKAKMKAHFSFGYKIMLSQTLDRIYQNIYNLVIGHFFLPDMVGYYTRSSTLVQVPVQAIGDPLSYATFPVLASMQDDNARLQVSYKKLMQQSLFLVVPILTMMILIAEPLFRLLLTDKWLPAVPYFRILCLAGMLSSVNAYNLNILEVKGRSDLFLKLNIFEKILITVGVLISVHSGIYILMYFQVAASVVIFLVNSSVGGKLINYSGWNQVLDVYHIFLITLVAGACTWVLAHYWKDQEGGRWSDFYRMLSLCAFFLVLYLSICITTRMQELQDFKHLVLRRLLAKYFTNQTT
jgi:teichuronic acid exporter